MKISFPSNTAGLLEYRIREEVAAFSTMRDAALPYPVLQGHQTHEDRVEIITDRNTTRADLEGIDAMITALEDFAIGVRTADCVPILMYDPHKHIVAAVHSGWKGTVRKITSKTIRTMSEAFGTAPGDIMAVIGPSISPVSFQVGQEVADKFLEAGFPEAIISDHGEKVPGTMWGGIHIDLWEANRVLLERTGVLPENILVSGIDTYSRNDLFFSARREGTGCGRIINSIKLIP